MASTPPPEHHEFRPGQGQPYSGEPPGEYIHSTRMAPPAGPWHPPLTSRQPTTRHTARHLSATRPRSGRYPWWLPASAAVIIAGAAATAVLLTASSPAARTAGAGHTGTRGAGTAQPGTAATSQDPPAISRARAQRVLAAYTTANNQANKVRSDSLLAAIETGSSYQMDTGTYRFQRASDPANHDYTPLDLTGPTFYIPREAASVYPHWFVAKVTYRYPKNPQIPPASGYVLFTRAFPGATWKNTYEPNVLAGSSLTPGITTDAHGYAEQASLAAATAGLQVPPGQLAPVTASALDGGHGTRLTAPDNLQDQKDQKFWRSHLPQGSADTDTHHASPDAIYGLRTDGGGALLFYAVNAKLTLAYPGGEPFQLEIPGYYSPTQTQTSATVGYIDQFSAYDPPHHGSPRIIADASGIAYRG